MRLYEVIDDPSSSHLFLVLDFVENGTCLEWDPDLRKFDSKHGDVTVKDESYTGKRRLYSENKVAVMVDDILHGLEYLHVHHIAHRLSCLSQLVHMCVCAAEQTNLPLVEHKPPNHCPSQRPQA